MANRIDITGKRFSRWLVTSIGSIKNNKRYWNCICDCGEKREVEAGHLHSGKTRSCGCLQKEINIKRLTKHGMCKDSYRSDIHVAWQNMKKRCYRITNKHYKNYGGRGIIVCDRWINSFENFYADMGNKPTNKHTIERINNDGNYEPSNCKWATRQEQLKNKRIRKDSLIHDGKTTSEWAKKLGITTTAAYYRIKTHGTPYLEEIRALKATP